MEMNAPIGPTPLDGQPDGLVGQPLDRVDGPLKVMGHATYAYEFKEPAGVAYGFVAEAKIAKGRIAALDTTEAEKAPGVIKILTFANAPKQGQKTQQVRPVLVDDRVDFYGQPIAFVVAETFEQARAAAARIKIRCESEAGRFDLKSAMPQATAPPPRNGSPADSASGDFNAAFASAPVRLDVTYTTPLQTHAMMEPHATLAVWDGDRLSLYTANQMPNRGQDILAQILAMPKDKIRLVSRYIGGGFGSKLTPQADAILAALAARMLARPVKVALTRQQEFHITTHRSNTVQRVRLGADVGGNLVAVAHESWSGNQPGDDNYEGAAIATRSLYAAPNRMTAHRLAALDLPTASAMRAPGEAAGMLVIECAMDELAEALKLDPIELRVRNEPMQDPEKHIPYSTRQLVPCMRHGAKLFGWDQRQARPGQVRDGRWLVGMGMAAASRGNPLQHSRASVRIGPDGIAVVRMAMTDIGTGTYTILTQIAGEMLGLSPTLVRVELGDTDFPLAAGSGGSFGAGSAGSALYDACVALRAKLLARAGFSPESAIFADGKLGSGVTAVTLASLAGPDGIEADGEIKPGKTLRQFSQQSYGAHFAEVGVDQDTGEIRLRRMLSVFAAGRILNAKTARSQAIGGMVFGIGAALTEEVVLDPRYGCFVNHDLAEYHVPAHADVPAIDAIFLPELDDKSNPLKSKGIGELGICGAGAAIANAVYNATGIRIRDYPLTLDKILSGFEDQERPQRRSAI